MIALHTVLFLARLERRPVQLRRLGQEVFDLFCRRYGRQHARNGGRGPDGAAQDAADRRRFLRTPGGIPEAPLRPDDLGLLEAALARNVLRRAAAVRDGQSVWPAMSGRRPMRWPAQDDEALRSIGASISRPGAGRARVGGTEREPWRDRNPDPQMGQESREAGRDRACPRPHQNFPGACRSLSATYPKPDVRSIWWPMKRFAPPSPSLRGCATSRASRQSSTSRCMATAACA